MAGALLCATFCVASIARPQRVPAPDSAPAPRISDSLLAVRTRELAAQLRCPVCQGLSLQDSPSELSQEMRDVVRDQLRAGRTPEEVKQYFVARYGEWILMEPAASGFNWLVYLLPVLALAGGAVAVALALRRWTSPAPEEKRAS
jgi:cytochrome c-type biogenesis protein CcmH